MKKNSRTATARKNNKKNVRAKLTNSPADATPPAQCRGGDGDQGEENEKKLPLSLTTDGPTSETHKDAGVEIQPETKSKGVTLTAVCKIEDSLNTQIDNLSLNKPGIVDSGIVDCETECVSVDNSHVDSYVEPPLSIPINSEPALPLPLNCVWGNGMQFQTAAVDMPTPIGQYPLPGPSPAVTIPVPVVHVPHFNMHLPFPDRSGNMNLFTSLGLQGSMLQPPAPTLNASLGYPSVYVSPAGLITVLLKYDIAVEMTVDKNIRVVNHRHKTVAATNNRGSSSCVYHFAAKVYQDGTKTEVEVFGERRARMQTNGILFASALEVYLLDENHILPSHFVFNDMSKDSSVNVLFTPGMIFTNDILVHCDDITKNSRYYFHKDGSTTIIINNIKIHQDERGEVQVTSGPRYICTSPVYGNVYLQTHFVEISVQVNWNVSVQRGSQKVNATYTNFVVCNGQHEAGFNQFREVFSRAYNPTVSEFECWLPSLTYLCQGLPQTRKNRLNMHSSRESQRNRGGEGDQGSTSSF